MRRVVITGLGALSPIGNNAHLTWEGMKDGKSGAGPITKFDASQFRTQIACELKDFDASDFLDRNEIRRTDPFAQYALIAASEAMTDSGIDMSRENPFDAGVIWGSGQGGMQIFEEQVKEYNNGDGTPRFNPFFVPKLLVNIASGLISMKYGMMGVNYTPVSACATSNSAIMEAFNHIRWGQADIILTGGSEASITTASIGGFAAMKAMSNRNNDPKHASRPFDVNRDGFVMGEGATALILEEYEHAKARGAKIYAEVAGAAMTADAYHLTATHPEGIGATEAMRRALVDGKLNKEQVNYINAHATSTPLGDRSETMAIASLFGQTNDLLISATKSMTGHLLGAAGAVEALACVKAINEGIIPPTINTEEIDPAIPQGLNFVLGQAREAKIDVALSNTFGFGGHNATVIFKSI